MKKLLSYFGPYRRVAIAAPLFKFLEAVFELLIPLVVAAIIDNGIPGGDRSYVVRMVILMAALGVVGWTTTMFAQYFSAKAATGFSARVREAVFTHIGKLSYSQLDGIGTSTLITRMTGDVDRVETGVNMTLRLLMRAPLIVFGAMIMAFTVDARCALIFVGVIPVLFAVVFTVMFVTIPMYRRTQGKLDRVLGITRENLAGTRVLRAFCMEESEKRRFTYENGLHAKMQKAVGRIGALLNPLTLAIVDLAIVLLIRQGAVYVDGGELTQGELVALYNYLSQILVELVKMANLIVTINRAIACGNRIEDVLSTKPDEKLTRDHDLPAPENGAAVEFRHVSLRYPGAGENTLSDVDLTVMPGETVGVIGGTGSGKTSLVNLIPGFYRATDGKVLVSGIDVNEYTRPELSEKIAVVPQKAVLFRGTIRENLLVGNPDATDEDLMRAVAIAQATDVVNNKQNGLDEEILQGGKNLSGGQRQRLTVARALVKDPEVLILDDSASALDYATDSALRVALREWQSKRGGVVFIVSQRAASVRYADHILVLEDGQVIASGKNDELLATCDVYREIYETQFGKGDAS